MRTASYDSNTLKAFLKKEKIATIEQLKHVLGTGVNVTVFRKLQELAYLSSYSHRGKFYTLPEIVTFDGMGLWHFESVSFSKFGNLLKTICAIVDRSPKGFQADELEELLHVVVNQPLLTLLERKLLVREKIAGVYVYVSADREIGNKQLSVRVSSRGPILGVETGVSDEVKAAIVLFFCLLDEQQKRLYAGVESLKIGYGGDRKISELLGIDDHTVARGRAELLQGDILLDRKRNVGGGRKRVEKKLQRSSRK